MAIDITNAILKASGDNVVRRTLNKIGDKIQYTSTPSSNNTINPDAQKIKDVVIRLTRTDHNKDIQELGIDVSLFAQSTIDHRGKTLEKTLSQTFSAEQLKVINDVFQDIDTKLNGYLNGSKTEQNKADTKAYIESCMGIINTSVSYIADSNKVADYGVDGVNNVFSMLDSSKHDSASYFPSQADLDVVTAFRGVGIDLELVKDKGGMKWVYSNQEPNSFAITLNSNEPPITFTPDEVNAFLDNYLNKDLKERDYHAVTPAGVIKTFFDLAEKKIDQRNLSDQTLENTLKTNLEMARKQFKVGSQEFEIAKLTDPNQMFRNAQKIAISEILTDNLDGIDFNIDSTEIQKSVKDKIDSLAISSNVSHLDNLSELLSNAFSDMASSNPNNENNEFNFAITPETYDIMIESLTPRVNEPEISKRIIELQKSKQIFMYNIEYQKDLMSKEKLNWKNGNYNAIMSRMKKASNEAMKNGGFTIDKEGEVIMGEIKKDSSLMNKLRERVQARESSQEEIIHAQEIDDAVVTNSAVTKRAVNIDGILHTLVSKNMEDGGVYQEFATVLDEYSLFTMAKHLLKDGNYYDKVFQKIKAENPSLSEKDAFNKFLSETTKESNIFNKEILSDAYCELHPESEVAKDTNVKESIEGRRNNFIKQLVIMDMVSTDFTEEEFKTYYDPNTPDEVREKLVQGKFLKAHTKFAAMDEKEKDKRAELAELRHSKRIQKDMIEGSLEELAKNGSNMPPLFKGLLEELIAEQKANNDKLTKSGESVVLDPPPPEKEKDKYLSNFYPSAPNKELFIKKMKPFHGKEIQKFFFDPLLEYIYEKMPINMEAMKARQKSSEDNIPQQQPKKQGEFVKIGQREFEASIFSYASIITDSTLAINNGIDPKKDNFDAISYTMQFLSTTAPNPDHALCSGDKDGKGFRDELRCIMFDVCEGGKETSVPIDNEGKRGVYKEVLKSDWASEQVDALADKYGIPPNNVNYQTVKRAVETIAEHPEIGYTLLSGCSEITTKDGKQVMHVGKNLPVEELCRCHSDTERKEVIGQYAKANNGQEQVKGLFEIRGAIAKGEAGKKHNIPEGSIFEIENVDDLLKEDEAEMGE